MKKPKVFDECGFKIKAYSGKISKKLLVFYNPLKRLDRELCRLILKLVSKKDWALCDLLSATGARGIILSDLNVKEVVFNDANPNAVKLIKENIKLNKKIIKSKISVFNKEANDFLFSGKRAYNYIDIDPFGTPNPFLSSIKFARSLIGITATDSSALVGTYPKACLRKYNSIVTKTDFFKEIGIRILIKKIIEAGSLFEKALIPVFGYSYLDYYRVYFKVERKLSIVNNLLSKIGFIIYCKKCLKRKKIKINESWDKKCSCGCVNNLIGPIYLGNIWDSNLLKKLIPLEKSYELQRILDLIKEESQINAFSYISIPKLFKKTKKSIPKFNEIIKNLKDKGYKASRTHFDPLGIRTNPDVNIIKKLI